MSEIDPEMDEILRKFKEERLKDVERQRQYEEELAQWRPLRDAAKCVVDFTIQEFVNEIGRIVSNAEFYAAWAVRLANLGRMLQQRGLRESLSEGFKPKEAEGKWTRKMLLHACDFPDDVASLERMFLQVSEEPRLHSLRVWMRKALDPVLNALRIASGSFTAWTSAGP